MRDYDARIVDLYDGDNPAGDDHEYYRTLAERMGARSILDIGCGTGILTVTFAALDRTVVGVDPSHNMITYARNRPGADQVTWIEGDTRAVSKGGFDLIVMTGNVAQHIPDPDWERTLTHLRSLANPGATLAFESRNPAVQAWKLWHQPKPTERETVHGPLQEWYEATEQGDGKVRLRAYNLFVNTEDYVIQEDLLTFRSLETISRQLTQSGWEVTATWGDWHQTSFDGHEPIMVFEARAD